MVTSLSKNGAPLQPISFGSHPHDGRILVMLQAYFPVTSRQFSSAFAVTTSGSRQAKPQISRRHIEIDLLESLALDIFSHPSHGRSRSRHNDAARMPAR